MEAQTGSDRYAAVLGRDAALDEICATVAAVLGAAAAFVSGPGAETERHGFSAETPVRGRLGVPVATLRVLDPAEPTFGAGERETLERFGRIVGRRLADRVEAAAAAAERDRFAAAVHASPDVFPGAAAKPGVAGSWLTPVPSAGGSEAVPPAHLRAPRTGGGPTSAERDPMLDAARIAAIVLDGEAAFIARAAEIRGSALRSVA